MDIVCDRLDAHHATFQFSWNDALTQVMRDTLGRSWLKEIKRWSIPTDHVPGLARRLQALGHRILISPTYMAELRDAIKSREAVPDVLFGDDVADWRQPSSVITVPRPYQRTGVTALGLMRGGTLLADPTGVGKTLEAILDHEVNGYRQGANSILWIVPSALRRNIRGQYRRHMGLDDDEVDDIVTVIGGTAPKRKQQWLASTDIKVVGYEMYFRFDWAKAHVPREWNKVYADEITKVKNRASLANKHMRMLDVTHGITGMTATPLEMHLEDAYQIIDVLRPGVLGTFWQFRDEYLITNKLGMVIGARPERIGAFSDALAPYMIKRDKAALMPWLPPKVPTPIDIALPDDEQKQYNEIADNFIAWVALHGADDDSSDAMTQLLRLRQYVNSPNIVDPTFPVVGEKMRALFDVMEQHVDDSVVIFSQWVETARRVSDALAELGYPVLFAKAGSDYFAITERINAGEHIVLVTTDAAAYGLDMYGAHVMVHYDGLWNPAKMVEQREGRLHRGDQKEPVIVYTLTVEGTFEAIVREVMERRQNLAAAVYDGAELSMLRRWRGDEWELAAHGIAPARLYGEEAAS